MTLNLTAALLCVKDHHFCLNQCTCVLFLYQEGLQDLQEWAFRSHFYKLYFKLWTDNTPWIDDVLQNKTKTCITVRVHHVVLYWVGYKGTEPYIFFSFVTSVLILVLNQCGTVLVVNCFVACISCESCQEEDIIHSLLWGGLWPKYKKETGKGRDTSQEQIDRMLTTKEAAQLFLFSFPIFVHFVLEWGLGWKRRDVNLGEAKCLILILLFFSWDLL